MSIRCLSRMIMDWQPRAVQVRRFSLQQSPLHGMFKKAAKVSFCDFCQKRFPSEEFLNAHYRKRHTNFLLQTMMDNPVKTYNGIFGDKSEKINDTEARWGDIIVALEGEHQGLWRNETSDHFKSPIELLQKEHGLSIGAALQYALAQSGLSMEQFLQKDREMDDLSFLDDFTGTQEGDTLTNVVRLKQVLKVRHAWNVSKPLAGSVAEKYLVMHRGIPLEVTKRLAFRSQDPSITYDVNAFGEVKQASTALVVPMINPKGALTGCQKVYLDELTAKKQSSRAKSKVTLGICRGSAGIVQRGTKSQLVYVAEGPETAATIATIVGPEPTVFCSLSVFTLSNVMNNVIALRPENVIVCADRDEHVKARDDLVIAYQRLKKNFTEFGIGIDLVLPQIEGEYRKSIDFNDVLLEVGPEAVKEQLQIRS